jgi:hypothetical protein
MDEPIAGRARLVRRQFFVGRRSGCRVLEWEGRRGDRLPLHFAPRLEDLGLTCEIRDISSSAGYPGPAIESQFPIAAYAFRRASHQ